jgi:hypothetical protein
MNKENMVRAEFHCHSIYSYDSTSRLDKLLQTARQRGVQRLCITDHNTIEGALHAKQMDPDLVVVGEEVMTSHGELIGLFLQEEIPAHLPALETIRLMREQGAFITIPHPCDIYRTFWTPEELDEVVPLLDAVEVFNAHCFKQKYNEAALELAERHNKPFTVGSDAHIYSEVGLATLELPDFHSADELRQSVQQVIIHAERVSPLEHAAASGLVRLRRLFSTKRD